LGFAIANFGFMSPTSLLLLNIVASHTCSESNSIHPTETDASYFWFFDEAEIASLACHPDLRRICIFFYRMKLSLRIIVYNFLYEAARLDLFKIQNHV
jgi:hypothetical protein